MTELSDRYTILFIEEPEDPGAEHTAGTVTIKPVNKNLTVFTPHLQWDGWKVMCRQYLPMLDHHVEAIGNSLFWFYSPFYVHLLNAIDPSMIVYDCMDELSAFKNASPNLPLYEKQLLQRADIVFTGGKSLYEIKKKLHPRVYCFPSSVNSAHFEQAEKEDTPVPQDIAILPKPVAGYYGVIDERIDFSLLEAVAQKMPHVSFVMIGPFSKIERSAAPRMHNIYYLGKREYALLPGYLKNIDVAIMPFAMNEATRYISPTKTLEFMAAGKPIVSSPVYDIVRDYRQVVGVACNAGDFANQVQQYLSETAEEEERRRAWQRQIIERTSWTHTILQMENIMKRHPGFKKGSNRSITLENSDTANDPHSLQA